jgi:peptide/nickel transport system permease protein
MKVQPSVILRFIKRNVPGVGHFALGDRLMGSFLFLYFIALPVIALSHLGQFINSLHSLILSGWLLITEYHRRSVIFRSDVAEHWIAALFLLVMPVLVWLLVRRSYFKLLLGTIDHETSQWTLAWRELRKNRIAFSGLAVILIVYTIAFLCPFLVTYHPNAFQDTMVTAFKPPFSTVQVLLLKEPRVKDVDAEFLEKVSPTLTPALNRLVRINAGLSDQGISHQVAVDAFHIESSDVIVTSGRFSMIIPLRELIDVEPERFLKRQLHPLGTDSYGRDLLSRIVYGSRISLSLGFITVLLSITIGAFIGLIAGYFGRFTDTVLMRLVDVLLAFPSLFLILIIIAVFDKTALPRVLLIIFVLGLTSWMGIARIVRAEVLSLKEREFILAARALGLSHMRILFRHILPNSLTPIIVNATLRIGGIILLEAALSFLNIGVQAPTPSWGNIIFEGKDYLATAWWISTFPGFAIVFVVVCFNLVGDGLRDAFDPMLKES